MSRLDDLEARVASLGGDFVARLPARRDALSAHRDHIARGDLSPLSAVVGEAHKLRGTARSFGHADVTTLATEIEEQAGRMAPADLVRALDRLLDALDAVIASAPARTSPAPTRSEARASAPDPSGSTGGAPAAVTAPRHRVLVLDDDDGTRKLLCVCLRPATGFETTPAATWSEAFERLAEREVDLVVTDWMMPDGDGLAFLRALRASTGPNAGVPVVVVSAAAPREPASGEPAPVAWIQKPFLPRALVERLLEIARARPRNHGA